MSSIAQHDLVVVTLLGWLILEVRQSSNDRPEADRADRGSRDFLRASYVVGVLGALVLRSAARGGDIHAAAAAAWAGLVILWAGVLLRVWSFRTLGRYFTFTVQTSDDQPVITAGPYRVLRHPSYTGALCAFAGLGFIIGNWWSLIVITFVTTCGFVHRVNVEEAALLASVGERYRTFAATRKRLVPFIW